MDIDFVMRPFAIAGLAGGQGKAADPALVNDTRQLELHLDAKDSRATLLTNQPAEEAGGQTVYWRSSNEDVATVDRDGVVRAPRRPGRVRCHRHAG